MDVRVSVVSHVFSRVRLWSQNLGTWNSGKLQKRTAQRIASHSRAHTDVIMCYWWYGLPPPSGDCWESFLVREHTPQPRRKGSTGMLSAADKRGHRGSRLHSRLIVLEALICQGSAGNQVGIYSTLLCLLAGSFHVEQREHFDRTCTLHCSAAPSCPRLMKMLWW